MNTQEIGQLLKQRRRRLGVNQAALSEMSGAAVHTLSDIESGKANPTVKSLLPVLEVLGLELVVRVKGAGSDLEYPHGDRGVAGSNGAA